MHPKTYHVRLSQPLGTLSMSSYMVYVHASSEQEALDWTSRTFVGVDTRPTQLRWATPTPVPRIGNSDPVSVIDCDRQRCTRPALINGPGTLEAAPPGQFRHSEEAVAADLFKVFGQLMNDREKLARTFDYLKSCFENDGFPGYIVRLRKIKTALDTLLVWLTNVWQEYLATQQRREFVLPLLSVAAA